MKTASNKVKISSGDLVYPYFLVEGQNVKKEIPNLSNVYHFSINLLLKDIAGAIVLGINKVLLFGVIEKRLKNPDGSAAYMPDNLIARAVRAIKNKYPDLIVITDICLCGYTDHGHCGTLKAQSAKRQAKNIKLKMQNDVILDHRKTLDALSKMALSHAEAGADYVAPSAMAKKQVYAIRKILDENGYKSTRIMGYSAKFASNFYGPFREAVDSAPAFGDRSGYQLAYSDTKKAIQEIKDDIKEGADIVMVKPALAYLDIIKKASERFKTPLAAYNVSGEYAMIKYGAKIGLWGEKKVVFEVTTAFKRAGADIIITYYAKDIAKWIREK